MVLNRERPVSLAHPKCCAEKSILRDQFPPQAEARAVSLPPGRRNKTEQAGSEVVRAIVVCSKVVGWTCNKSTSSIHPRMEGRIERQSKMLESEGAAKRSYVIQIPAPLGERPCREPLRWLHSLGGEEGLSGQPGQEHYIFAM